MKRLSFKKIKPKTPFLPCLPIPAYLPFPSPSLDLRIPKTGTPQGPSETVPLTSSHWAHFHQVLDNPFPTFFFTQCPSLSLSP